MTIQSNYSYDDETGLLMRRDTQDVSAIIDANKEERISGINEQRGKEARKFASVPLVVLEDIKNRLNIDYMKFGVDPDHTVRFLNWLKDPDNMAFRTSEAKLGHVDRFV
jgi:hypothetical protein